MSNWFNQIKIASGLEQEGWTDEFGDVQRYVLDAYAGSVYITKTSKKITVSVTVTHNQFGHIMWQHFWAYPVDQSAKAKNTYKLVKQAVHEVFEEFRLDETPNNLLHSVLREAVRGIDQEANPPTRIPFVDWARYEKGQADWRSSIYGTRYPESDGF